MNDCLKSISLTNLTTHVDNFNDGMIIFFDNLEVKYDKFIYKCKKITSEIFDIDNLKNSTKKNTNSGDSYSPGYNFINTHKNQRDNSPTELKEIVCISNDQVSEHIFVKTEQITQNISKIKQIDNPFKFKKSKSFNDRFTFLPEKQSISNLRFKSNNKSCNTNKNKSINNIQTTLSPSSPDTENSSDDSWDILNN